jgi:hypothetical protein
VRGCCPELDKQIQWAQTQNEMNDKRKVDYPQDIVTTLEYGAAFNPTYHEPELIEGNPGEAVYRSFQEYRRKQAHCATGRSTSLLAF